MTDTETGDVTELTTEELRGTRALIEVQAGVIPGTPDPSYRRAYAISSDEWDKAAEEGQGARLMAETNGLALGYANMLMLQPDRLNWVSTMWIWL